MGAFLIAIMILIYTLQSLFCKIYADYYPGEKSMASGTFSIVSGLTVAIITFAISGFSFNVSGTTILLAVFNAAALSGYNYFLIASSQRGSYSILMIFSLSGSIIIPSVVSLIAYGEKISLIGYLSIVLIIYSVYLVSSKKEETTKPSKAFLIFCTALGLCNGLYGTLLNVQQRMTGESQKDEMVILTFLLTSVFALTLMITNRRKKIVSDFKQNKKSALFLALCSLTCAFAVNILVLVIPIVKNITLIYTFNNSGVFLLSVISSWLIFKEKLSRRSIIGCVLIVIGLVCISVFK